MEEKETGGSIDMSQLALKMLEWEKQKNALDALGDEIEQAVLTLGKTQKVGNVTASYSGGRRIFDYAEAGKGAPAEMIEKHRETVTTTDWRKVCKEAGIAAPVLSHGAPSVKLKLS